MNRIPVKAMLMLGRASSHNCSFATYEQVLSLI